MEYNLYYYDSILDAVVMKDKDDNELVIECTKANAQVIFNEPEDEGYLVGWQEKSLQIMCLMR